MSKSFQDENEFNTLAEATFFANVNELITAFSIGLPEQFLDILNSTNHLPLEKPYIKPTIIDFEFYGYCATISYSALREYLIANNNGLTGDEKDFSFLSFIWLKVRLVLKNIPPLGSPRLMTLISNRAIGKKKVTIVDNSS